jgi:hypothetical protein
VTRPGTAATLVCRPGWSSVPHCRKDLQIHCEIGARIPLTTRASVETLTFFPSRIARIVKARQHVPLNGWALCPLWSNNGQVTALDSDTQVAAHIEDLSMFGCLVETMTPFVAGTKVSIESRTTGLYLSPKEELHILANMREWASLSHR